MTLKAHKGRSNCSEIMRSMVGETVIGIVQDYDGNWWLVVESGFALVLKPGNMAFWVANPDDVKKLIAKRKAELGTWAEEAKKLVKKLVNLKEMIDG